jgi:hypothetical protein
VRRLLVQLAPPWVPQSVPGLTKGAHVPLRMELCVHPLLLPSRSEDVLFERTGVYLEYNNSVNTATSFFHSPKL